MSSEPEAFSVIDGDGHINEDMDAIRRLMPPEWVAQHEISLFAREIFPWPDHFHAASPLQLLPGSFERVGPKEWLRFQASAGIAGPALYPTRGLAFGYMVSGPWAVAACRAYNDWLYNTYLTESPRFIGMGLLPCQEPMAAAEELHRIVTDLGMAGGILPATGLPEPLGQKRYEPIYEAADLLKAALSVHGGNHSRLGLDHFNVYAGVNALGHPFSQSIAFASLLLNGIFDRYPGIRVAFLEGGAGWMEMCLERLHRAYETHRPIDDRGELAAIGSTKSTTDYIVGLANDGRFFYGCEGDEEAVALVARELGVNPALYSTDFPHEVNLERCVHELNEVKERNDLSPEFKRQMLSENARKFYGLDRSALRSRRDEQHQAHREAIEPL